jgi:hypothetical protein
MLMTKIMLAAGPNCLHNSGLWILFCSVMCAHWDIRRKGMTSSFKHCMPFIKAIGIPSCQSFEIKFTSFGIGYMHAEPPLQSHGGLPFPFLLTHILKKKGIKGTLEDGPVTKHPLFGRNQWNHNQSHIPRGVRVQIPAVERVEDAEHMEEDASAPQQGGRRGFVVISHTEYELLCDANQCIDRLEQHFDNMEKWFEAQDNVLKAILERLPPAAGASSSVPYGEHQ